MISGFGHPPWFLDCSRGMEGVYCRAMEVNSQGKYRIPAHSLRYICQTLAQYEFFGFRLDLPLHRQSSAARFGVLRNVLGTAVPVRDWGTFGTATNYI